MPRVRRTDATARRRATSGQADILECGKCIETEGEVLNGAGARPQPYIDSGGSQLPSRRPGDKAQDEPMHTSLKDYIAHRFGGVFRVGVELTRTAVGIDEEKAIAFAEEGA